MIIPLDVVAAVIVRPDGRFLLAQRPHGKVYAGYWEFPGGKVEPGESLRHALRRELHEELGIEVELAYPWITRVYTYPHATVRLHFHRVTRWSGNLHAYEHQAMSWESAETVGVSPLLPANGPVLHALKLPAVYAITHAAELGRERFLKVLGSALGRGLKLVQLREKQMAPEALEDFGREVITQCRGFGARVLINGDVGLAGRIGADGVHLDSRTLMSLKSRPAAEFAGASCHNPQELEQAVKLALDFVALGPVLATPSHPDARPLGWEGFGEMIRGYPLPVYALGGMRPQMLSDAWKCGAHGIAMLRGAWV